LHRGAVPYDVPFASNPLTQILADSVDFERLVGAPIKLFVTATNVRTGAAASSATRNSRPTSCSLRLPATMFQAVEIDGEAYWTAATRATRRCRR